MQFHFFIRFLKSLRRKMYHGMFWVLTFGKKSVGTIQLIRKGSLGLFEPPTYLCGDIFSTFWKIAVIWTTLRKRKMVPYYSCRRTKSRLWPKITSHFSFHHVILLISCFNSLAHFLKNGNLWISFITFFEYKSNTVVRVNRLWQHLFSVLEIFLGWTITCKLQ